MPSRGEQLKAAQARHRHRNFVRMIAYLTENPCVDCGEADPIVLDFDHLPQYDKRFEIARAVSASTRSWSVILEEIQKCEVVCANCHRRRTARRARHRKHQLSEGILLPMPPEVEPVRAQIPHGGGAKGRHRCDCDPCRLRRNAYAREHRRTSARAASGDADSSESEVRSARGRSKTNIDKVEADPQ